MNADVSRRPFRLTLYTDADSLGGAEQSLRNLLEQLGPHVAPSVLGVDADVVDWIASARPGTRTTVVRPVRTKRDAAAMVDHARAIRGLRPDVFHANLRTTFACRYGILLALLAPGVRVIAVEQLPTPEASPLQRRVKRALSRLLDAHVAVGAEAARQTEEIVGLPRGRVRTIHNGIPLAPFPSPEPHEGAVVGAVGRLVDQKGFDVLIRALPSLENARCVIVGDGPERTPLERLAEELGVRQRLTITGWVDDARAYLPSFDAYCLPSRFEGFPLSLVEAMLAGLPIVASDVGSVAEAIRDSETGLLARPGDPAALAAALRRLLDDGALATSLGARARTVAEERFTADRMARSYEALYDELVRR